MFYLLNSLICTPKTYTFFKFFTLEKFLKCIVSVDKVRYAEHSRPWLVGVQVREMIWVTILKYVC